MGFIDRLLNIIYHIIYGLYFSPQAVREIQHRIPVYVGTFMPYFYQDKSRTYFAQPE